MGPGVVASSCNPATRRQVLTDDLRRASSRRRRKRVRHKHPLNPSSPPFLPPPKGGKIDSWTKLKASCLISSDNILSALFGFNDQCVIVVMCFHGVYCIIV